MHRDLRALFEPRSVAVVGASGDGIFGGNHLAAQVAVGDDATDLAVGNDQ